MVAICNINIEVLQTINKCYYTSAIVGRKCELTPSEKDIITSELSKGKFTLKYPKKLEDIIKL